MGNVYMLNARVTDKNGNKAIRKIRADKTMTLVELCEFIMFSFSFIHEHSYEFLLNGSKLPEDVPIDSFHLDEGQEVTLHYDFGDDWMFKILIEKVRNSNYANQLAILLLAVKGS